MTTQAIERVQQWATRSFAGGYRGLHDLADEEFSGVVRATGGTLCMLNGAVVGIVGGTIEDFENAEGTAYEAPSPALPLLIVMQARSDEVRAKYYTEDTPLSKVDSTLSDGGFTGFIELSENVLSGDYYVVYHGGRSMSVAFVGESSQLHTDEEAFDLADDEVGIYEVRPVEIDPMEIPEPESPPPTETAETSSDDDSEPVDEGRESETDSQTVATDEPAPDADDSDLADSEPSDSGDSDRDSVGQHSPDRQQPSEAEESGSSTAGSTPSSDSETQSEASTRSQSTETDRTRDTSAADVEAADTETEERTTTEPSPGGGKSSRTASEQRRSSTTSDPESSPRGREDRAQARSARSTASQSVDRQRDQSAASSPRRASAGSTGSSRTSGSAADLETRTIPSLDPARTGNGQEAGSVGVPTGSSGPGRRSEPARQSQDASPSDRGSDHTQTAPDRAKTDSTQTQPPSSTEQQSPGPSDATVEELQETIAQREERIETLEEQLSSVREERDDLAAERNDLQTEVQQLQETLSTLREEREALEAQLEEIDVDADRETPDRRLSRREAMDGTNLFVRYNSKGDPTLQTAYESGAGRKDVNTNLNVESHTQFERDGTVVSGAPFEDFLEGTIEHQFVSWVVRELLFEIRDTGHQDALADLYDALPRVDRAELNGAATVEYTEDGQTKRSQESFDIVLRDRMGNPLVVANINDSRQAASEDQMTSLVTAATRVAESNGSLAGAMFVTASFFEPGALETAADATGGGLLSRDKRESFVKTSRKQGYHLCLVEARDDQFHMAVPEL